MHHQQRSRSLRFRTSSRGVTAALTITIAFALAFVLIQSAQTQSFHAGGGSMPLPTQDPRQHARAFPRLSLGSGREVTYVGMFSSDATFRKSSKLTRFLDALNVPPSESPSHQAARQSGVPSWMLSSNERVVDDIEPPGHAMALPEVHSLVGSARDAVVSLVYGRPSVLRTPQYLTTDSQQRVILSDPGIPAVHVLDPKRKTSFSILGGQGRRLRSPAGVAVDGEDNIYVADSDRGMVLVYDQYGKFVRYIGNFHGENMYQRPTGIAIDRKAGHLYLADSPRHLIFILDLEGHLLKRVGDQWDDTNGETLKSRKDIGPGKFDYPTEIAVSDHQVAVLDMAGTRVQIMDLECNLLRGFSFPNAYHQQADKENGLALDKHGSIYVSYAATSEVRMYNSEGGLLASFGQAGSKAGEFSAPRGLWVDASNRLYVSDTQNIRVQLFQLTGDQSDGMPNAGE
jgi:sugar lactone lactonase YvrE